MSRRAASPVGRVLDRAAAQGRVLDLWWRDDDAVAHTPALDRLLGLAASSGCPVAIAAIPARIEGSLVDRLRDEPGATVLVHGFSHANHAPAGEKPAELGAHRPPAEVAAELRQAVALARAAFGRRAPPVLVPPWNRIAPEWAAALPELGFRALSGFGKPVRRVPGQRGFRRVDTHIDPVAWRGDRSLVPPETLGLSARAAILGGTTALGLLTHHLAFDEALWRFLDSFLEETSRHPAVRFRRIEDLLEPDATSSSCLDRHGSEAPAGKANRTACLEPAW